MDRRRFLTGIGVAGAGLALGWARVAQAGGHGGGTACGTTVDRVEEEFLDEGIGGGGDSYELAHFFSSQFDAKAAERFCVGRQGRNVVFASPDGFQLRTNAGKLSTLRAPDGGHLTLDADNDRFAVRVRTGSRYEKVMVLDAATDTQEFWGDAYGLGQIVPTSSGLAVSYGLLESSEGRLALVTGKDQMRERLRLQTVPTHLCAMGNHLVYFLHDAAYSLDLGKADAPKRLGRLPTAPTATVLTSLGVTATSAAGIWQMPWHGLPYRMSAEANATTLFLNGTAVIAASLRRAWIWDGANCRSIEAPNSNLHYIAPIDGSDDLILCRGPAVLRYHRKTGKLERIGHGRPKMKLRGAALVNDRLLTWSTQTWEATDWDCQVKVPPRVYLVE